MKIYLFFFTLLCIFATGRGYSQILLKTDYIGSSQYMHSPANGPTEKAGESRGGAFIVSASADIPFSIKKDEQDRKTIWGASLYGAHLSFNNKHFSENIISGMNNYELWLFHVRPLGGNTDENDPCSPKQIDPL